ncbi:hypothetical protein [Affinirhizobium pseudoryzae]|uniref:hypothetical protein n=1 Tax=Allorhizobium pseudoryzae TaxID=379684 RepID=UPI0013ED3E94|nr:hypothetical protein [Allorhizobium pseudoryzae]
MLASLGDRAYDAAIAEHMNGTFELISWQKIGQCAEIMALPAPSTSVGKVQAA